MHYRAPLPFATAAMPLSLALSSACVMHSAATAALLSAAPRAPASAYSFSAMTHDPFSELHNVRKSRRVRAQLILPDEVLSRERRRLGGSRLRDNTRFRGARSCLLKVLARASRIALIVHAKA